MPQSLTPALSLPRYPFHDSDTSSLFAKIRCGEFKVPEWVSSRARHLITALLRRDPARRMAVQDVLSHPWLTRPPRDHPLRDPTDHTVPTMFLQSPSHRSQSPKASSAAASHAPSLFGLQSGEHLNVYLFGCLDVNHGVACENSSGLFNSIFLSLSLSSKPSTCITCIMPSFEIYQIAPSIQSVIFILPQS